MNAVHTFQERSEHASNRNCILTPKDTQPHFISNPYKTYRDALGFRVPYLPENYAIIFRSLSRIRTSLSQNVSRDLTFWYTFLPSVPSLQNTFPLVSHIRLRSSTGHILTLRFPKLFRISAEIWDGVSLFLHTLQMTHHGSQRFSNTICQQSQSIHVTLGHALMY